MNRLALKRTLQFSVGIGITAVFLMLIARNVDGRELAQAVRKARGEWIGLAIGAFLIGYACRIARWRSMLAEDNPRLRWGDCAVPLLASVAANNVLPLRLGDILRVFGFTRQLEVPTSMMLASLLVERLLDLMCLLIALGSCIAFIRLDQAFAATLFSLGGVGIAVLVVLVGGLLLFPLAFELPARLLLGVIGRFMPGLAAKLGEFSDKLFKALRHLSHGPRMLVLFAWSGGAWTFEGLVFLATAKAIPGFDPVAGWLAFPVSTLATLLPSSPGYVGTFDFFAIQSAEALGNGPVAATAFALLVHLVIWLPATLLGGACLAWWSLNRKQSNPLHDARMQIDV